MSTDPTERAKQKAKACEVCRDTRVICNGCQRPDSECPRCPGPDHARIDCWLCVPVIPAG